MNRHRCLPSESDIFGNINAVLQLVGLPFSPSRAATSPQSKSPRVPSAATHEELSSLSLGPAAVPATVPASTFGSMFSVDSNDSSQPPSARKTRKCTKSSLLQCLANLDFSGADDSQLSFKAGDIITIIEDKHDSWWFGELNGKTGLVPKNHVAEIARAGRDVVKATAAYKAVRPSEMNLSIGDSIIVRCVDAGWGLGECLVTCQKGWFPLNHTNHPDGLASSSSAASAASPSGASAIPPAILRVPSIPKITPVVAVGRVLYNFVPQEARYIELKVDDIVSVTQKEASGWWHGTNIMNQQTGWFPGHYLQLMSTGDPAPTPNPIVPEKKSADDENEIERVRAQIKGKFTVLKFSELQILETLASGHFGTVNRARWFSAEVVVKQPKHEDVVELANEAERSERVCRHPNVVPFIGACIEKGHLCLVSQYMKNGSLEHVLMKQKKFSEPHEVKIVVRMARDVVAALSYLHSQGVIHRDIAARNVLLDEEMRCRLCDFGLSRVKPSGNPNEASQTHSHLGPLKYMAPESFAGDYSAKSDVWMFGVLLWEMFTREEPFLGLEAIDVAGRVRHLGLRLQPPDTVPAPIRDLMNQCFQTEPAARPDTTAILTCLDDFHRKLEMKELEDSGALGRQNSDFQNHEYHRLSIAVRPPLAL